jgi:hypothetical protein
MKYYLLILFILMSCSSLKSFVLHPDKPIHPITGSAFYEQTAAYNWKQRDSLAIEWLLAGNLPDFLAHFKRINVSIADSATGKTISGYYFVSPDYLSVGTNDDWARIDITPMAAQKVLQHWQCSLPTRKMVDDIYQQAKVKLAPVPMYAFRDSSPTMWQHHLIIEGQRKGQKGLIAGIKKDVVISTKIYKETKKNKVAIFGWHKLDGKPIQPLYTGHVNWYVDYSHGIRMVYNTMFIDGKQIDYKDVLRNATYAKLICDEPICDYVDYIQLDSLPSVH